MKLLTLLCGMLFIVNASALDKDWTFRDSGTICSVYSSGSIAANTNETIQYSIAFAYASKEHALSEHLRAINLKPNEYVLQFDLAIHQPADEFGLLGDKIDIPIQLRVNEFLLKSYENEYGTTYYVRGKRAKQILQKLNGGERISVKAIVGNVEHLIPIKTTENRFNLKRKLLETCEEHFV
jgi:hypothetical protein